MEKSTRTLLEDYASIYERPTKRNAVNIQMRKKQNELEPLPKYMFIQLLKRERERERNRLYYHNNKFLE